MPRKPSEFTPQLVSLWKDGTLRKHLPQDLASGLVVGIVALPLAIAFAIASGVSPEKGLITAVIAGFAISALGGSRVQIGGPTGAFIVIVYAIVQEHGVQGLTIATFMAGLMIMAMGFLRLGNTMKFVPYPLIVGFTSGIAVIIFSSQVKDVLGLPMEQVPAEFIAKWEVYAASIGGVNGVAAAIAAGSILLTVGFSRVSKRVPGSIVAIVLSTLVVWLFDLPVDTIESKFGEIPNRIPMPSFAGVSLETLQSLIQPAIAIALLGSIESLLSAVVADGLTGGRHRPNIELVGQGAANMLSALFGGIPATGAIARTATNVRNGGRTPIAGMTHAVVLLLIMLLLAPIAKLIPLSALAGILVVISWNMAEWHTFRALLKGNAMDILILLATFFVTVFFDLILAIEIGLVLSSFLFMKRMSESMEIREQSGVRAVALRAAARVRKRGEVLTGGREGAAVPAAQGVAAGAAAASAPGVAATPAATPVSSRALFDDELPGLPEGVILFEIQGPLFFGASQRFQEVLLDLHQTPKVLILRMREVPFIDASGVHALEEIVRSLSSHGTKVLISGANRSVRAELLRAGLYRLIGRHNIHADIDGAMERAQKIVAG
jgi:SulP family sulfate permease